MSLRLFKPLTVQFAGACLVCMAIAVLQPAVARAPVTFGVGADHRESSKTALAGSRSTSTDDDETRSIDLKRVKDVREQLNARTQRKTIKAILSYVLIALLSLIALGYLLSRTKNKRSRLFSLLVSVTLSWACLWAGYATFADYKNERLVEAGRGGRRDLSLKETPWRFWMVLIAKGSSALLFGILAVREFPPPKNSDN